MRARAIAGTMASEVSITGGTGTGRVRLTAFDAALQAAGIHEANLIRISSITPAVADVSRPEPRELVERIEPGAYHPAVYAEVASDTPGDRLHAAVAGARLDAGHGINVEHHAVNTDEENVRRCCEDMLEEMADRRGMTIAGSTWIHQETCTVPPNGTWAAAVAGLLYHP